MPLTRFDPSSAWSPCAMIGSMRHDLSVPIAGESFRTYVEEILLPALRPGDIVVMDNLGSNRSTLVRQLIRSAGAKLFILPKYSPDPNPIELVFAKLKHLLRPPPELSIRFAPPSAKSSQHFTPEECANHLENSGYRT